MIGSRSAVLLVGAFGQGNPGDEALCDAVRASLRRCTVTVASRTAGDPNGEADVIAPTATAVAHALRRTDVLVIGGGTVFKRLHPSSGRRPNALLRSSAALVAAARARGTSVALVGVGAADLAGRESKALARWIVRHSDLMVLRDEESASVLAAAGAPVPFRIGADPAWMLAGAPAPHAAPTGGGRAVTVALSHLAGDRALVERLAAALAPLATELPVRLQPWQVGADDRDARMADELAARLGAGATVVAPPTDLVAARDGYRDDRLVVALRFHAVVAAGAAGTPVLAIAHEPKLAGLARRLGQPAVPPHASAEVLRHAVRVALDHPAASAAAVAREVTAATASLQLLQLLVDRGVVAEPATIGSPPMSSGVSWW